MMESEKKSLDSMLSNLKLVKMEEDTKLAEDYINENDGEFYGSRYQAEEGKFVKDMGLNQIFVANRQIQLKPNLNRKNIRQKLSMLADQIKENAELFSQLDFLSRGRPVEESKRHDLKLIVNFIRYWSENAVEIDKDEHVLQHTLNKDDPLAALGLVIESLLFGRCIMRSHVDVAVVSKLFTDLCQNVGLPVYVTFHDDDTTTKVSACCDGVITENSDHESAIDAFIGSTPVIKCPWKLRRIFIQESCYEECKNIFIGKDKEAVILKEKCSARCQLGGKQFVFDYVGDPGGLEGDEVLVEPYRTTKELLGLLNKYQPRFLCLWSSYISEANEIAYSSPGDFVWINDYCDFNGHPGFVTTFYQNLYSCNIRVLKQTRLKSENWRKTDFQKRKTILKDALNRAITEIGHKRDDYDDIISEIEIFEPKQVVEVTKNKIVIRLHNALEYYCVRNDVRLRKLILVLLNGITPIFVCKTRLERILNFMCDNDTQIPIQTAILTENAKRDITETVETMADKCWSAGQFKWIVTSFGTQIAN